MTELAASLPQSRSAGNATTSVFDVQQVNLELGSGNKRRPILEDINLEVGEGEIVGIIGPSGTGKTSLLRVLAGLESATSGSVQFDGESMNGPSRHAVTVFQDYAAALLPWRTVEGNVALPIESRQPKAKRKAAVAQALAMVGLEHRGADYPWQLSGGMQQRVQIARALVLQPRVLLLDEPFGALDAITKASLQDQVLALHRETGMTVVFVTHDLEEAAYMSDRVVVLAGTPGRVIEEVDIDLPRPRDQVETRDLAHYTDIRHSLGRMLRDGHRG